METESQGSYYWFIPCLMSCDFDFNTIKVGKNYYSGFFRMKTGV